MHNISMGISLRSNRLILSTVLMYVYLSYLQGHYNETH